MSLSRQFVPKTVSAAPELLTALQAIADHLESLGDEAEDGPFVKAARAALAKATGAA